MTDISNFCDISEDQGLSERSSKFSLDVEDPNEERGRLGYPGGGINLDRPYMDEPLAYEEWLKPSIKNEGKKEKGLNVMADALMEQSR